MNVGSSYCDMDLKLGIFYEIYTRIGLLKQAFAKTKSCKKILNTSSSYLNK